PNQLREHQAATKAPKRLTTKDLRELDQRIQFMMNTLFPAVTDITTITNTKAKSKDTLPVSVELKNGTYVMFRDPLRKTSTEARFQGPFKVINQTKAGTYVLQDIDGKLLPRNYHSSSLHAISDQPLFDDLSHEVEAILQHKKVKGKLLYLVRWKNHDPTEDSWEPTKNFDDPTTITNYWK
ncbi:hypothetical protein H4R33_003338, partial [Dimargaris cristalligena]